MYISDLFTVVGYLHTAGWLKKKQTKELIVPSVQYLLANHSSVISTVPALCSCAVFSISKLYYIIMIMIIKIIKNISMSHFNFCLTFL